MDAFLERGQPLGVAEGCPDVEKKDIVLNVLGIRKPRR
jgi:hypothetical protein